MSDLYNTIDSVVSAAHCARRFSHLHPLQFQNNRHKILIQRAKDKRLEGRGKRVNSKEGGEESDIYKGRERERQKAEG